MHYGRKMEETAQFHLPRQRAAFCYHRVFFSPSLPFLSSLPSELPRGIAGRPSAVGSQSIEPRLKPCSRSRRENSLAQTPFTCAAEHSRGRQGLLRPASYTTRSASAIERLEEQRSERLTGGPWALLEHTIVTDTAHLCRTVAQVVQEANGQSHIAVLYVRCSEGDEDDARNVAASFTRNIPSPCRYKPPTFCVHPTQSAGSLGTLLLF